jgi:hypothetical protein
MTYREEFPSFPAAEMVAIPAVWEDISWAADACPSFKTPNGFVVYTDRLKAEDREHPDTERFSAYTCDETGARDGRDELHTDDWNALLAFVLGAAFVAVLKDWLTADDFAEMQEVNATPDFTAPNGPCASHNYCDANMAMSEAFEVALGREPDVFDQDDGAEGPDVTLWNAAWNLATPSLTASTEG